MNKPLVFSQKHLAMIEKSVRYMISDLQYEQHQALAHGCAGGSYDKEIEEYRQLKQYINDAKSTKS